MSSLNRQTNAPQAHVLSSDDKIGEFVGTDGKFIAVYVPRMRYLLNAGLTGKDSVAGVLAKITASVTTIDDKPSTIEQINNLLLPDFVKIQQMLGKFFG
jgi:hypothetical protein